MDQTTDQAAAPAKRTPREILEDTRARHTAAAKSATPTPASEQAALQLEFMEAVVDHLDAAELELANVHASPATP